LAPVARQRRSTSRASGNTFSNRSDHRTNCCGGSKYFTCARRLRPIGTRKSGIGTRGHGGGDIAAIVVLDTFCSHGGGFASGSIVSTIVDTILVVSGNAGCSAGSHVHDTIGEPGAKDHRSNGGQIHDGRGGAGDGVTPIVGSSGFGFEDSSVFGGGSAKFALSARSPQIGSGFDRKRNGGSEREGRRTGRT
jgi:hypothetical protein